MRPRLIERKKAIASYCGIETGPDGDPLPNAERRAMNLTKHGADVLVAHLAANPPTHDFVANRIQNRGRAKALSVAMDRLNGETDRVRTSRMGLLNALLSERTVCKIGVRSGAEMVKLSGRLYDAGQPYAKNISNDDHGYDFTARCIDEIRWERNIYRVSRELVNECGLFNPKELNRLSSVWDKKAGNGGENVNSYLLGGEQPEDAFIYDSVELMDVYFYNGDGPSYLCTCAGDPSECTDWLRVEEWTGPERGPYEWLEFYPTPDNIKGTSWAGSTEVQAVIASKVMRKIVEGVLRAKKGMGVEGDVDDKEIKTITDGPDGFVGKFSNLASWKEMSVGGATADSWKLLDPILQWWNMQAGNISVLGGTNADSSTDTLGEYQGMAANAGVVMGHLQRINHEFEERKSRQLAFWLQNDPLRKFMSPLRVPNGEFIEVMYDPMAQEDDHSDYEYKIRDGSMKASDPNVLLRRLMEFYGVFLPTGALDVHEAALTFGEVSGVPNMESLVPDQMRQMETEMAYQGVPGPMQGQPTGPSQVNPKAMYGVRPQGAMPSQPMQPRPAMQAAMPMQPMPMPMGPAMPMQPGMPGMQPPNPAMGLVPRPMAPRRQMTPVGGPL